MVIIIEDVMLQTVSEQKRSFEMLKLTGEMVTSNTVRC